MKWSILDGLQNNSDLNDFYLRFEKHEHSIRVSFRDKLLIDFIQIHFYFKSEK